MAPADDTPQHVARVLDALRERPWLLQVDPVLPSVTTLVTGEPIAGSWWSHPQADRIFRVLQQLESSPDILFVKLVKGKVTLVHRALWTALVSVVSAYEPWQTQGLSAPARTLQDGTNRRGTLRLDELDTWSSATKPEAAARELEQRLLVYAQQFHTESGRHAKRLESWTHLMQRLALPRLLPHPDTAKRSIEGLLPDGGRELLPWLAPPKRRRR